MNFGLLRTNDRGGTVLFGIVTTTDVRGYLLN